MLGAMDAIHSLYLKTLFWPFLWIKFSQYFICTYFHVLNHYVFHPVSLQVNVTITHTALPSSLPAVSPEVDGTMPYVALILLH